MNAQPREVTETSNIRTKILTALKAPSRNEKQLKAKIVALLNLYPKPADESFLILKPEDDYLVDDLVVAKEILSDAELEELAAKVEVLGKVAEHRFLIRSDLDQAIDTRLQAPTGTVTISSPTIPETKALDKDNISIAFSASDLTLDEFTAVLKAVDRKKCRITIGGFQAKKDAENLLTGFGDRAEFKQTKAARIAKVCNVPDFVRA